MNVVFTYPNGQKFAVPCESRESAQAMVDASFRLLNENPNQRRHFNLFNNGFIDIGEVRMVNIEE